MGGAASGGYFLLFSLSPPIPRSHLPVSNEKGDKTASGQRQSALPASWMLGARGAEGARAKVKIKARGRKESHPDADESITLKTHGQAGSARALQPPLRPRSPLGQRSGLAGRLIRSVRTCLLLLRVNLRNPRSRDVEWAEGRSSDKTQRICYMHPLAAANAPPPACLLPKQSSEEVLCGGWECRLCATCQGGPLAPEPL